MYVWYVFFCRTNESHKNVFILSSFKVTILELNVVSKKIEYGHDVYLALIFMGRFWPRIWLTLVLMGCLKLIVLMGIEKVIRLCTVWIFFEW